MSLFNSLGSNYNFSFVLKSLFTFGTDSNYLKKFLEDKYSGKVTLLYKGRHTIELALKVLDLEKNSYVAINGFTCFAVYEAVKNAGLNIEYLDIEKGELNFSADTLQKAVTENPHIKAVIIQNTLGYPADMENISGVCKRNNIHLIEDLAHSIGTIYADGKEAGTYADFVSLSFSQDKMIDGISGGALIIKHNANIPNNFNNVSFTQQLRDRLYPFLTYLIRNFYSLKIGKLLHFILKKLNLLSKPMPDIAGFHKLPNWYAKLIYQQFKNLDNNLNHRKTIAGIYSKLINPKILSPKIAAKIPVSSNLRFPIFVNSRSDLTQYLGSHQIYVSDIWYDAPIAPKKYLPQTDYQIGLCPDAELASDEILNLPTHINVSEKNAERISQLINQWLKLQ